WSLRAREAAWCACRRARPGGLDDVYMEQCNVCCACSGAGVAVGAGNWTDAATRIDARICDCSRLSSVRVFGVALLGTADSSAVDGCGRGAVCVSRNLAAQGGSCRSADWMCYVGASDE